MSARPNYGLSEEKSPQGLKPASFVALDGTAESRALPNTDRADIKDIVKQKYGEAALRVKSGGSSCCGAAAGNQLLRSHHHEPLRRFAGGTDPGRGVAGLARLRQSDGARAT